MYQVVVLEEYQTVPADVGLVDVGGDSCTTSNLCTECHGDCDSDADCAGDLVCF